jgi:DNA-binding MarR family transcriptional regulator
MQYGFLKNMVGVELRKAQINAEKKFEQQNGKQLLPGHYTVLVLIKYNPGATQSAIAQSAGLNRSSLVPLLKQFEEKGLITRKSATRDTRSNITELTVQGEELIGQHQASITQLEDHLKEQFGEQDYLLFVKQLQKFQKFCSL